MLEQDGNMANSPTRTSKVLSASPLSLTPSTTTGGSPSPVGSSLVGVSPQISKELARDGLGVSSANALICLVCKKLPRRKKCVSVLVVPGTSLLRRRTRKRTDGLRSSRSNPRQMTPSST